MANKPPDGQLFRDYLEVQKRLNEVQEQLDNVQEQLDDVQGQLNEERQAKELAKSELQQERQAKELAEERAKRLEKLLREAGIDTDSGT